MYLAEYDEMYPFRGGNRKINITVYPMLWIDTAFALLSVLRERVDTRSK